MTFSLEQAKHRVLSAAIALLAGCAAPQPFTAATAVPLQSQRVVSGSLLYAGGADGNLYVYSYPGLRRLYAIAQTANAGVYGECSDGEGDVYATTRVPNTYTGTIYEYRHGAQSPVSTLSDPGEPSGCAVDPSTGNLAVSNFFDHSGQYENLGEVVIYPKDGSAPERIAQSSIYRMYFCAYDPSGNLFVLTLAGENQTYQLYELPRGTQHLDPIALRTGIVTPGAVQWNDRHLTVTDLNEGNTPGPELVYTLKLHRGAATVIGTRKLATTGNWHFGQTLIDGGNVLAIPVYTYGKRIGESKVSMWTYPSGGPGALKSTSLNRTALFGLAVSK